MPGKARSRWGRAMGLDRRGVWSTPVVLLLGLVMTAGVLSVGLASLDRMQRVRLEQLSVEDFDRFLERVQMLGMGGEGGTGFLELSLDGEIKVGGGLAQLVVGSKTLRVEELAMRASDCSLTAGRYRLELRRDSAGLFIEIRGGLT